MATIEPQPAWVIICEGEVDQICYSQEEAKREVADLKAMGFDDTKARKFESYVLAQEWADAKAEI